MRTHIMDLIQGDRLKSDAFNKVGLHVLPKGTTIRSEEIALLIRQNINYVDIEIREGEELTKPADKVDFSQRLRENFDLTIQGYQSIFLEALTTGKFNQSMVDDKLKPFLETIDDRKDVVSLLLTLGRDDVNIYNHSLQVGLLSYYIATWLGYSKEEVYNISKAGYLHDIGKSQISQSIRNRAGQLVDEELEEMKRHTKYGYDIIRSSMVDDETTALVALQHHEYEDRSGYPLGIGKNEIHPYAEIVAVANVYVDLTSSSEGHSKQSLITVLREVYGLGFGKLNERPVQALIHNLLPNFIGKNVLLSNGEMGTIVFNHPTDFFKPLVKVDDFFRDLSRERDIVIEEILLEA
ncbi:HD-GYP domain-containing protein [Paenibacillus segetis]|uniref:HD family phosphohydrolase n=1 Tax=Paenibacillus segetis TaxID=1325360 RepID=A0ABQ1YFT6_9BACL|nr:HD domain-containing phosphohydrolase [Paenibacillus segetis]GGH23723.1 HD family phosphohydrolase [Paenibacillus segetis]